LKSNIQIAVKKRKLWCNVLQVQYSISLQEKEVIVRVAGWVFNGLDEGSMHTVGHPSDLFPGRNNMYKAQGYIHISSAQLFKMELADGHTLQQHVPNVERLPSLGCLHAH
jgi:hypothetical protein